MIKDIFVRIIVTELACWRKRLINASHRMDKLVLTTCKVSVLQLMVQIAQLKLFRFNKDLTAGLMMALNAQVVAFLTQVSLMAQANHKMDHSA